MELTAKNKAYIDGLSYYTLLYEWRFAKIGDEWFQGETGDHWGKRMAALREVIGDEECIRISKEIGW